MKIVRNDLSGQTFGRLHVLGVDDRESRHTYFLCQCDCGNIISTRSDALTSGATVSCGCKKREQDRVNLTAHHSHKMSGSRIYGTWIGMKMRCYNKRDTKYYRYGGRGISVCDEWRNSFKSFYEWSIENGYSEELTIDRINNDGNYEPSNCRWSTMSEQCNNRSSCVYLTIGNSTRTITEWCSIFEVDPSVVFARHKRIGFYSVESLFRPTRGGDDA